MKLNVVLTVLTFTLSQVLLSLNSAHAAMNSEDWADLFEMADTVLNDGSSSNSKSNQKSNSGESERSRAKTKNYEPSNNASGQARSSSSGKSYIIDEATHCLQVISAVDERRCGRPGGYEFTVKNSCHELVKFTIPLWDANGRFKMLNEIHTVRPNSTTIVWGCDLNGQYGKYMSACYERSWLKTCRPLNGDDYDENGNLITH